MNPFSYNDSADCLHNHPVCTTGVSDANIQNNAGYTAVMLASLTVPYEPGGMEVVRKLMEQGNVNIRSSQVTVNANKCI